MSLENLKAPTKKKIRGALLRTHGLRKFHLIRREKQSLNSCLAKSRQFVFQLLHAFKNHLFVETTYELGMEIHIVEIRERKAFRILA